jgi:hypothetical protein
MSSYESDAAPADNTPGCLPNWVLLALVGTFTTGFPSFQVPWHASLFLLGRICHLSLCYLEKQRIVSQQDNKTAMTSKQYMEAKSAKSSIARYQQKDARGWANAQKATDPEDSQQ